MNSKAINAVAAKVLGTALVAGALMLAAPQKAAAQAFSVGVQFGAPAYGPYAGQRAYDRALWERRQAEIAREQELARRQEWIRRQEWVRAHELRGRQSFGYGYNGR